VDEDTLHEMHQLLGTGAMDLQDAMNDELATAFLDIGHAIRDARDLGLERGLTPIAIAGAIGGLIGMALADQAEDK
jgi:hypothetical protein